MQKVAHKEDYILYKTVRISIDTWKRLHQKKLDEGCEITFDYIIANLLEEAGYWYE